MKKLILFVCCFSLWFVTSSHAQVKIKIPNLDSINGYQDTASLPAIEPVGFYNYNFTYKLRLDSIQKTVPLPYNEYVQNFITIYSKRKDMMGKMLGLSSYYFPIFEKALIAYNIPVEIKYLPIIESSMNPHAVSRVGATGLWQFMFGTAKGYGLNIDNFVDERKDPIQASYAAAAYFRDAYDELGDWLLAIAAYNCGMGNVNRAIAKADSRDFWEIRRYLPKETRDYVPAFIASLYVMKYAKSHDIVAQASKMHQKTDTIHVNHFVSLTDLSKALELEDEVLLSLNPSYKKKIVNGTEDLPKRIVLPSVNPNKYEQLYDVLNSEFETSRKVILASTDDVRELRKKTSVKVSYHKVRSGQNLGSIADIYHVEVQDLKVWNKLKSTVIVPGQKLKIYSPGSAPKSTYLTYKVKAGDTLSGIAEKFEGATVANIKEVNGLSKNILQPGMVLKINKG
ncbi:lytic transglycosylase domain-containing protein [Pedobacter insulae]|uniref:Membrane-bound lytic murein transglycosylase D n=1 Tax=Pedobacter insulae TaxID=414048 RepID=A0A1I2YYE6_9SPHI|nr:lytic transglycosylase domain-containing protein [Pedobacter insulae]SFH30480.1 membrane-bound lytic murein transglycosylase D [Pedobacter insulae]